MNNRKIRYKMTIKLEYRKKKRRKKKKEPNRNQLLTRQLVMQYNLCIVSMQRQSTVIGAPAPESAPFCPLSLHNLFFPLPPVCPFLFEQFLFSLLLWIGRWSTWLTSLGVSPHRLRMRSSRLNISRRPVYSLLSWMALLSGRVY